MQMPCGTKFNRAFFLGRVYRERVQTGCGTNEIRYGLPLITTAFFNLQAELKRTIVAYEK
jgi:hypothetical protein